MSSGTIGHWSRCSVHQTIVEVRERSGIPVLKADEMAKNLTTTELA